MLSTIQDRTVDFFEFALDLIEKYDKEYVKKREEEKKHNNKTKKKLDFSKRIEFIKDDFELILTRHATNVYDYTKDTKLVTYSAYYVDY